MRLNTHTHINGQGTPRSVRLVHLLFMVHTGNLLSGVWPWICVWDKWIIWGSSKFLLFLYSFMNWSPRYIHLLKTWSGLWVHSQCAFHARQPQVFTLFLYLFIVRTWIQFSREAVSYTQSGLNKYKEKEGKVITGGCRTGGNDSSNVHWMDIPPVNLSISFSYSLSPVP